MGRERIVAPLKRSWDNGTPAQNNVCLKTYLGAQNGLCFATSAARVLQTTAPAVASNFQSFTTLTSSLIQIQMRETAVRWGSCEIFSMASGQNASRYDRVIYHFGNNSLFHGYMFQLLDVVPGIVVCTISICPALLAHGCLGMDFLEVGRRLCMKGMVMQLWRDRYRRENKG